LAFLVKGVNSGTLLDEIHSFDLDENALRAQTASVLSLIANTDRRERLSRTHDSASRWKGLVFGFSYKALAASAAIFVVAVSTYIFVSGYFSPASQADRLLAQAMKSNRNIAMQVPGMAYSDIAERQRAGTTSTFDTIAYDSALRKVSPNGEIPTGKAEQLEMAKILIARNNGKQDAQKALQIIDGLPATGELLNLRGMALFSLAGNNALKNEEAIAAFTSALQTSPTPISSYFNRAIVEDHLGRREDAQNDLQKYIDSEKDPAWRNEARKQLSQISSK